MKKISIYAFMLVLLDQIIKYLVSTKMVLNETIEIIDNFFHLTYVRNTGAAFSILEGNQIFLIIVAVLAVILVYIFLIKDKKLNKLEIGLYSLLISGIIGNLIDRIVHNYVIDYLDFKIFNYNAPIFNAADIYIVVSCIIIGILVLKEEFYDRNKSERRILQSKN